MGKEASIRFPRELCVRDREMERTREVISYDLENKQFSNQLSRQREAWTDTANWVDISNLTGMEFLLCAIYQKKK